MNKYGYAQTHIVAFVIRRITLSILNRRVKKFPKKKVTKKKIGNAHPPKLCGGYKAKTCVQSVQACLYHNVHMQTATTIVLYKVYYKV